jgi:hypothetical protein
MSISGFIFIRESRKAKNIRKNTYFDVLAYFFLDIFISIVYKNVRIVLKEEVVRRLFIFISSFPPQKHV